jgi:hypothetical protein
VTITAGAQQKGQIAGRNWVSAMGPRVAAYVVVAKSFLSAAGHHAPKALDAVLA